MVARASRRPSSEVLAHDCATCERSVVYPDQAADMLCCTHPLLVVPGSPVEIWRGVYADLDANGWPSPHSTATPCPTWLPGWGEES